MNGVQKSEYDHLHKKKVGHISSVKIDRTAVIHSPPIVSSADARMIPEYYYPQPGWIVTIYLARYMQHLLYLSGEYRPAAGFW